MSIVLSGQTGVKRVDYVIDAPKSVMKVRPKALQQCVDDLSLSDHMLVTFQVVFKTLSCYQIELDKATLLPNRALLFSISDRIKGFVDSTCLLQIC